MIAFVRGMLAEIGEGKLIVDCGSIGYEVNVPSSVTGAVRVGSEILLYTFLNVREDEMSLFGFLDRDSLSMFRLLITISGIGPKGALGVLSVMSVQDLRFAVLAGDAKAISRAPGIGAKTAQRIVMELKDKVSVGEAFGDAGTGGNLSSALSDADSSAKSDAVIALTELGFGSSDALRAVSKVDVTGKSANQILKEALKALGR